MDSQQSSDEMRLRHGAGQRGEPSSPESESSNRVEIETARDTHLTLKKRLGFLSATAIVIGTIIGSGIFISPYNILRRTHSVGLSLVIWLVCGIVTMIEALCYAELGTMFPKSGGQYIYLFEGLGEIPAFIEAWVQITLGPASGALLSLVSARYFLQPFFDDCGPPLILIQLLASIVIVTISLTNCYSVSLVTRIQALFTASKVLVLTTIVIGGAVMLAQGSTSTLSTGFSGSVVTGGSLAFAIYYGWFAYSGAFSLQFLSGISSFGGPCVHIVWCSTNFCFVGSLVCVHFLVSQARVAINYIVEELKEPEKTLPRAIITGISVITLFYLLVNISYFTVLSVPEMLSSEAVAATWAEQVYKPAALFVPLLVALSCYGSMNGGMLATSRLFLSISREGHMPTFLSYITVKTQIPVIGAVVITITRLVYIVVGDIDILLRLMGFVRSFMNILMWVGFLRLRYTKSTLKRPFKVPTILPIFLLVFSTFLFLTPIVSAPSLTLLWGAMYAVSGLLFYFPFVHFKVKIPGIDSVATFAQLLFNSVPCKYDPSATE